MKTVSHRLPSAPRLLPVWLLAWLVVALMAASWLGGVHGTIHLPGAAVAATTVAGDTPKSPVSTASGRALRQLFGEHGHSGDCRLYDQLSHADGLYSTVAIPVVALPPVAVLAWHAGECLRRWATLFDARGPPSLS
jgi:hypothetical protein